ncbi:hypothetical protein [Methanoregula sp.]|uniref:hypothetical protein n=1 Tax=Methanoregula sp. TaxID=2052170 RepID=UPI003C77CBEB
MPKNIVCIMALCLLIIAVVNISGCTSTVPNAATNEVVPNSDPQTGIQEWVTAVNNKDIATLYDLEPDGFKQEVSFSQFVLLNKDNEFMSPNSSLTDYKIMNETSNITDANMRVMVYWHGPNSQNSTQMETIPLFFNFEESYENGEWRVWEIPW